MDFLQSQIKPHFRFNALNAIITLCQTDGLRAEKLITHLSYYLRRCFDLRTDSFLLLQDELQLVEAYVEIEKARFGDRLTVQLEGDTVQIEVWDNGIGISREQLENLKCSENLSSQRRGVGLVNIRRRLMHFCAEELKVTSSEGAWTRVQFQFNEMGKLA